MRNNVIKYLKDRSIEDSEIASSMQTMDSIPLTYSLSELMNDYERYMSYKKEKSRFIIDVRKPQFKYFLTLCVFCLIGIFYTTSIVLAWIL